MNMKGFTVKHPHGQLLVNTDKRYETRSKPTNYRGPVVIHAGLDQSIVKQYTRDFKEWWHALEEDPDWLVEPKFKFAHAVATTLAERHPYQAVPMASRVNYVHGLHYFNFGHILAYADIVGCYPIEEVKDVSDRERLFGDWTPGRYAWEIAHVVKLSEPIPYKGQLGLWNVPHDVVKVIVEMEKAVQS